MFVFPKDEFDINTIEEQLTQVRLKDRSFKYSIALLKDNYILKIYGENIDKLHRRALWVREKIFNNEVGYKIKGV